MAKKEQGRPSKYSDEVVNKICHLISTSTISLKRLLEEDKSLPKHATVYNWLNDGKHKDFLDKYTRAREAQADLIVDEMIEIADNATNDYMMVQRGDEVVEVENREFTNRSRLRIETRKWVSSKLKPKKYGDKLDVTTGGEKINANIEWIGTNKPQPETTSGDSIPTG